MRNLVYYVASTLDGFIAREDGSFADFPWDEGFGAHLMEQFPETFPAPFHPQPLERFQNRRFDAVVMGRKTYEVGLRDGLSSPYPTLDQFVFSRSLESVLEPAVEVVRTAAADFVNQLKEQGGKDIWLCGGGELASTLMASQLVDRVIVKVNPVLFGRGIPLFSGRDLQAKLELEDLQRFDSGHLLVEYRVAV